MLGAWDVFVKRILGCLKRVPKPDFFNSLLIIWIPRLISFWSFWRFNLQALHVIVMLQVVFIPFLAQICLASKPWREVPAKDERSHYSQCNVLACCSTKRGDIWVQHVVSVRPTSDSITDKKLQNDVPGRDDAIGEQLLAGTPELAKVLDSCAGSFASPINMPSGSMLALLEAVRKSSLTQSIVPLELTRRLDNLCVGNCFFDSGWAFLSEQHLATLEHVFAFELGEHFLEQRHDAPGLLADFVDSLEDLLRHKIK